MPTLNHSVGNLLLQWLGDVPGAEHVFRRGQRCTRFNGKIAGDSNQSTQFSEAQGEFASATCTTLCLSQNDGHGTLVEVGNFSDGVLVSQHLLGDESDETTAIAGGVGHLGVHVHFVAVAANTASEGRMHALNGIEVACCDENEITRNGFGLGQCTRGAL